MLLRLKQNNKSVKHLSMDPSNKQTLVKVKEIWLYTLFFTCLNHYWTPDLNEQSCDTLRCLFKTGVTVVVNGLGPKAKFQGKNLKSKVDFYLFLSFIPIHFFSPCYISITSQSYRQHSLVKPGRMQKDWAGMSRSSIQFSSQMSNFWPVSLAHLTEWLLWN